MIRKVKAKYGGQIRTPDLEGKQYIGIYEEVLPEAESEPESRAETKTESHTEWIPADSANSVNLSLADRIVQWLENHVTTITISAAVLILLAAGIWLLVKTGKKSEH